jgi:transcription initiation factor TFIID subunit TAF12
MLSPEPFIDVTVPSVASPYAVRTRTRRAVQQQQQQQQHQQQEQEAQGTVTAQDAASAVLASIQGTDSGVGECAGGEKRKADCTSNTYTHTRMHTHRYTHIRTYKR